MQKNRYLIFITTSLFLFVFIAFYFFANFFIQIPKPGKKTQNKFYLKNLRGSDPYITHNFNLENLLSGPIISDHDPVYGDKNAPVTIVVFSDFACSYCQKQEEILKKIIKKYPKNVKIIWKDYPEQKKDSFSWRAAVAGRCAKEQNKFWPYHDVLFSHPNKIDKDFFINNAVKLGMDKNKFQTCLSSKQIEDLINDNIKEANALDIFGVPFIYVNKQEIMGNITYSDLEKIVLLEIHQSN